MRRPKEIADRLWQELVNIRLWLLPPRLRRGFSVPSPLAGLPAPSRVAALLSETSFPEELRSYARDILAHRFPLLGLKLETGRDIHWRKDYLNGPETGCS